MALILRNPHSVLAALESRPGAVLDVRLHGQIPRGAWREVAERAERHRIPVVRGAGETPSMQERKQGGGKQGRPGIAEATVREREETPVEDLYAGARESGGGGLWLALDQIQDPHNVGAIFRSAAFFGVAGIVLTRDRSAPLNATVYDVASGGVEFVPFSIQTNLRRALQRAQEAGAWILGSSEHADRDVADIPVDRPWLLVLGNEESGLRRLTLESCDMTCRLSPRGRLPSLNVSVAAGVLMAALALKR